MGVKIMFSRYKELGVRQVIEEVAVINGLSFYEMDYYGQEVFHVVQPNEVGRLDIISYIHYETPEFWWLIAVYNQVRDTIFGFNPGDMIRIPINLTAAKNSLYRIG